MLRRYLTAAGLAAGVTCGLFLLMHALIASSHAKLSDKGRGRVVDFVRLPRAETVQAKKRELPERRQQPAPPATPQLDLAPSRGRGDLPAASIPAPDVERSVDLRGAPQLSAAMSDADTVPLVRVQPLYPQAAAARAVEGWVLIEFTISATGTVKDAVVVAAEPTRVFERSALRAIRRWKYKPRVEGGKPVERPGVRVRLTFSLDSQRGA